MRFEVVGFAMEGPFKRMELSQERFQELADARRACLDALGIEERFQLLVDNFREWEVEFLGQSAHYLLWDETHEKAMDWRLALDRRLVNLLSSCRLYQDQTSHMISRMFGNPSSELRKVEDFKHSLYDNAFEYRLLEALRNYVQHCGLVISGITFSDRSPSEKFKEVRVSATLDSKQIDRANFKKSVFDELEKMEEFDIRLPVRKYVSALVSIHSQIRTVIAERIGQARKTFCDAVNEFSQISNPKGSLIWTESISDSGEADRVFFFITSFLSLYDELYQRNSSVGDISKVFVSNAAHK